ncbi:MULTISPECIES: GyrI-like domain-containing protein [Bizionia]|uniref:GyrI-like domain-containing protein n=1 Tax=Bizionia algoritergicola TaxID=291187 RepID=A0A5D0R4I0_9FLAO|nr:MULTISPECIES: GyrI-like domain-containing protein [Bizionia]OBX23857.1 hypothetical protein BAA08_02550 [Bizionia sp. APA-3]TYB75548.1 GyrI-like domain-containing protein [Bizionia algoritergicola]
MDYQKVTTKDILIIGNKSELSFLTNGEGTGSLARQFMPRLQEITNRVGTYSFSIQNYKYFNIKTMTPETLFEKWIGVAVSNVDTIPESMESLIIAGGDFLVFPFQGSVADFIKFWQQLHNEWLPNSIYQLDNRPHFEKLPAGYNPMRDDNQEEIWIPIK